MSLRYLNLQAPAKTTVNLELATIAELRTFIGMSGTDDATRMQLVVDGTNAAVFGYLRDRFIKDTGEDYEIVMNGPLDGRTLLIPHRPLVSITNLERGRYDSGGWALDYAYVSTDYHLDLPAGKLTSIPGGWFPRAQEALRVVYRSGWATVPADIKMAVLQAMVVEYTRVSGDRLDSISVAHDTGATSYTFDTWPLQARRVLDQYVLKAAIL